MDLTPHLFLAVQVQAILLSHNTRLVSVKYSCIQLLNITFQRRFTDIIVVSQLIIVNLILYKNLF